MRRPINPVIRTRRGHPEHPCSGLVHDHRGDFFLEAGKRWPCLATSESRSKGQPLDRPMRTTRRSAGFPQYAKRDLDTRFLSAGHVGDIQAAAGDASAGRNGVPDVGRADLPEDCRNTCPAYFRLHWHNLLKTRPRCNALEMSTRRSLRLGRGCTSGPR